MRIVLMPLVPLLCGFYVRFFFSFHLFVLLLYIFRLFFHVNFLFSLFFPYLSFASLSQIVYIFSHVIVPLLVASFLSPSSFGFMPPLLLFFIAFLAIFYLFFFPILFLFPFLVFGFQRTLLPLQETPPLISNYAKLIKFLPCLCFTSTLMSNYAKFIKFRNLCQTYPLLSDCPKLIDFCPKSC